MMSGILENTVQDDQDSVNAPVNVMRDHHFGDGAPVLASPPPPEMLGWARPQKPFLNHVQGKLRMWWVVSSRTDGPPQC
jgi:hypothetical protein